MTGFSSRRCAITAFGSVLGLMLLTTSGSSAGNWQAKAPMPAARYTHAAATFNGLIHIVGGADLSTCSVLNAHDVYDPVNDGWTSAAPMQVGRAHPSAAVLNDGTKDLLYVVGGASNCGVKEATMEAYDPATNSWTYKASMPGGGRNSMGAAVIDNRLYVVGGIKTGEVVTASGEMYNPITDTWSPIAAMPTVRYAMAIGAIDGILYAAGGGNDIPNFTAVDAYDPASNSWSPRAPLSTVRAYVASTVVDGLLFAIGGQNAINLSSVEVYDPAANAWSAGPVLPAPRSLMPAAIVAGRIYVSGGGYTASNGLFGDTLVLADAFGPTTTATPSMLPNGNGWNNGDVSVTLSAVDHVGGAGVASIVYLLSGAQTGGATVNGNSTVVPIAAEGTTTIAYHAVDALGNVESDHQLIVRIDKTPPSVAPPADQTVNATAGGTFVTFSPSASDALSGIVSVQTSPLSSGQLFPVGTTTITITAYDAAGNSAVTAFNVTVVQKTLVSISVSPSSASIAPGQNQTFQAIGHFSDGTTQTLPSGNGGGGGGVVTGPSNPAWSVQMTPPIDVNACATPQSPGPLNFSSQSILDQGGVSHTTWSPGTPVVNVDGTITASNVNLILACTNNPAAGSITATWNGTRYIGTYSFNAGASSGSVSITGWSQQAPMPATRFSLAAASVNGIVYAIGGGNPSLPSPVNAYSPATNSWMTPTQMVTPREGPGAAAVNGKIYVVGGHVSGGIASGVIEAYDPVANTWITGLAPMPTPRAHLAVVTDGVYVYAIGGDTLGSNGGVVATVERYDPAANTWLALSSMPTPGNFVVAGVLNNAIVVAGSGNSSATDVYDIAGNSWHSGAPMPAARSMAAAGVASGGMYVVGGTVNGSPMHATWVYYPRTNQNPDYWSGPGSIPTARSQLAAAVVGDVVYAIGGMVAGSNPATEFASNEALSTPPAYTYSPFSGGNNNNSLPTAQWQSTNPSIAAVEGSGNAHANAPGQVTIIATAGANISCTTTNSCATLSVVDVVAPNLFLPPNMTREANNAGGANNVTFFASSFDSGDGSRQVNCSWSNNGSASFFPPSFASVSRFFPFGTTTVNCSASDNSGNTANGSFTITVRDTNPPFLNVPSQPFTAGATSAAGAVVNFLGPVSAFDSVDGNVTPSCTPASGSNFPIGSTSVSCTATDLHGNSSPAKTFTVRVNDRLTIHLPANIVADATSPAGAAVPFSVSATYFLGGTEPVQCFIITGFVNGDPQIGPPVASGATFPVGTTTVGCLANNPSGGHEGGFFTITVLSAQQILANLVAQAVALNQNNSQLQSAVTSFNDGNVGAACNQLGAYINSLQAQAGKSVPAALAAALIQSATHARAAMGC